MNIADALLSNARRRPDHPAIVEPNRVTTHAELGRLIEGIAADLDRRGVAVGDRVGVALRDTCIHLAALFAIARIGAVIVPMDWRWLADEKMRVVGFFDPRVVLVEADERGIDDGLRIVADAPWRDRVALGDAAAPRGGGGADTLLLSLSSGTTGTPKGPVVDHDRMLHRFLMYFITLGFDERERFMCATPLYFGGSRGHARCTCTSDGSEGRPSKHSLDTTEGRGQAQDTRSRCTRPIQAGPTAVWEGRHESREAGLS
ncbi:MAG: acyl--CoA ligase [Alphaproteobacteria bacterium]|nr:acyl--CoA ligase [Alphaproteobacteria bacterium]